MRTPAEVRGAQQPGYKYQLEQARAENADLTDQIARLTTETKSQLAAKNQMDYAVQVILQSPVQIALTIAPIVCLAAAWLGQPGFDLVFSPLLLASMIVEVAPAPLIVTLALT